MIPYSNKLLNEGVKLEVKDIIKYVISILDVRSPLNRREISTILFIALRLKGYKVEIDGIYPDGVEWPEINAIVDFLIEIGVLNSDFGKISIIRAENIERDPYIKAVARYLSRIDRRSWIDIAGYLFCQQHNLDLSGFTRTKKLLDDLKKVILQEQIVIMR